MLSHRHLSMVVFLISTALRLAAAQPAPSSPGDVPNAPPAAIPGVPNMDCGPVYSPERDNCVGAVTYPNGNFYRGEYHRGAREGFGFIIIHAKGVSDNHSILSNEPSIYAGEFRGDRLNGHGTWFTESGAAYAGTFIDNIPQSDVSRKNCIGEPSASWTNCLATISYPKGNTCRGEFMRGLREGIGLLEIHATGTSDATSIRTPVPGIYVGEFRGGRLNGRGLITMPGAGFFGTFADNIFTGGIVIQPFAVPDKTKPGNL